MGEANVVWCDWPIVVRKKNALSPDLPTRIKTIAPRMNLPGIPLEVSLLLPSNIGAKSLIEAIVNQSTWDSNAVLGLFLANPMLNFAIDGPRLAAAGVRWITNLPSVEQHDDSFQQQLADVDLDSSKEFVQLAQLQQTGINIVAVVSDPNSALAAARTKCSAIIVVPKVVDYAAGFPSMHQRSSAVDRVTHALSDCDYQGWMLCLADESEASHESLWPRSIDGIVLRPGAAAADVD